MIETGGGRQPPVRPIVDTLRAQVQTGRRGRETPRQRSTVGVTKDFNGARSVARPGIVRGTRRQNGVSGWHAAPRERIRARGRFSQLVRSFEKFDVSNHPVRVNGCGIDGDIRRRSERLIIRGSVDPGSRRIVVRRVRQRGRLQCDVSVGVVVRAGRRPFDRQKTVR